MWWMYRDNVSSFDVEAGKVVVVAVILQRSDLHCSWCIYRTKGHNEKTEAGADQLLYITIYECYIKVKNISENIFPSSPDKKHFSFSIFSRQKGF